MKVDDFLINPPNSCFVIGEVGQTHDGSLGTAHAFIDAIADTGAHAIKFQTHIADAESTPGEPWRVKFSPQDETRYSYWKRMEFSAEQWKGLKDHADDRGLVFLSSPFSYEAVDLLSSIGIPAWKVASGEVNNIPMLEMMSKTKLPVILSSGMSSFEELDLAVETVQKYDVPLAVLQCTTAYPCPLNKIGLNLIPLLYERYNCVVGLSDHSGLTYPGIAAVALGASILEVHVTLSKEMFGPDVPASLTTEQLRNLVEGCQMIKEVIAHPVDKDHVAVEMQPLRDLFTKSIVTKEGLEEGTILEPSHLSLKKPGSGIPAKKLDEVIGCRLTRPVLANHILSSEDIERIAP